MRLPPRPDLFNELRIGFCNFSSHPQRIVLIYFSFIFIFQEVVSQRGGIAQTLEKALRKWIYCTRYRTINLQQPNNKPSFHIRTCTKLLTKLERLNLSSCLVEKKAVGRVGHMDEINRNYHHNNIQETNSSFLKHGFPLQMLHWILFYTMYLPPALTCSSTH